MTRLRWIVFVALCGGTLFQSAAGCDAILAPILSSLVTSVVTGLLSNILLAT